MPEGLRAQFDAHTVTLKRLHWVSGGAIVLLSATALLPILLSGFSTGLRVVVGVVSAGLVAASLLATRAIKARLADVQSLAEDWTQFARDLKVRADTDPDARREYVAYLQDSREMLSRVPGELEKRGIVTHQQDRKSVV